MGQTGPLAGFAGFGNLAAAITGFYELTGWPDRPPAGPFGAYTDYIAPRFNAARDPRRARAPAPHRRGPAHRPVAGRGVDPLPRARDPRLHGERRVATRDGNRDRELAPHGVYPCAGDGSLGRDRGARRRATGARSASVIGRARARGRPALRHGRGAARARAPSSTRSSPPGPTPLAMDELERRLARGGRAGQRRLQQPRAGGRSAARAPRPLRHRAHTRRRAQAVVEAPRFRLSRTPGEVTGPAPTLRRQHAMGARDDPRLRRRPHRRARHRGRAGVAHPPHVSCRDPAHARAREVGRTGTAGGCLMDAVYLWPDRPASLAARAVGRSAWSRCGRPARRCSS